MRKQSGFTLIELVTVIVVLGILSAIAAPKFIDLQNDAKNAAMNGLKASLESASTLTNTKALIEGLGDSFDETLSSGIRIRYGYPFVTQTNLKQLVELDEDDWQMTGSNPAITFTLKKDAEGLTASEITSATSNICKLVYTRANRGERPDITLSGCTD